MTDCARGCTRHGHHTPTCTCTPECPTHNGHCDGCAPRPATTGRLCQPCTTRITDALTGTTHTNKRTGQETWTPGIAQLAAALTQLENGRLNTPHTDTDTTRRTNVAHHTPSPAWDTAEEVAQWALRMALACADANHHAGPFTYRPDGVPALTTAANLNYLRANLTWYATTMPTDLYDETVQTHRGLLNALGVQQLTHRLPEPCPSCDHRTLTRDDGTEYVTCRHCGRIWTMAEFDWLARSATA